MATVQGLDRSQRELAEAQTALSALNGEIGKIKFDPADSASVEAAIRSMERMVDQRAGRYSSNPIVGPLISKSKESLLRLSAPKLAGPDDFI